MSDRYQTDVVIIGAGPVGLFAVFECGMVGLSCHVIDSLDAIGGQCTALYPEKPIYDIPAYPKIQASDLIAQLSEQAEAFKPVYHLGQQVKALKKDGDSWIVTTARDTVVTAKAIIIAGGAGSFGPQRPPLEGLSAFEGKSVFYAVQAREKFRDKVVVIAGGGDSAVDWAISLAEIAKKLHLVHRRDKFKAAPATLGKLNGLVASGRINLLVPYQLSAISGEDGEMDALIVSDLDGKQVVVEADVLLPFFGLATDLGPVAEWGLDLERNHILITPTTAETSVKGIYAIGDIATYEHKIKLILTGFAEAAQAAHAIYRQINPAREFHFEYSTTSGVPGTRKDAS